MILLLFALPLYAQDHADVARAAFDASALPPPPRSVSSALPYITRLLALLPESEHAGYVKGPAGGENVAPLADGTLVRISRVMYPNGQIYKVLSDAPNGNPQWVAEDVNPALYVPFGSGGAPPPVVTPPPPIVSQPPPVNPGYDLDVIQRLMRLENNQLIAGLKLDAITATGADTNTKVTELRSTAGEIGMFIVKWVIPPLTAALTTWQITKD